MKTFAHMLVMMTGLTLANATLAAEPKGPRVGVDVAALQERMMAPDMMATGSIGTRHYFSIVFLADLSPDDPTRRKIEQSAASPIHLAAARAFVNADAALMGELRAQQLDTVNVVGMSKDADGNNVIYVK